MSKLYFLQDLLDNSQYSLLLHTSSSTFLSDADITINKEQALLWQRTKNDTNSFADDYGYIEKMILENPMTVFFGPKLFTDWELKNFPCLIDTTSIVLGKVFFGLISKSDLFTMLMVIQGRNFCELKCCLFVN